MTVVNAQTDGSLKGIYFQLAGITIFAFQNVIIKWISGDYPVHEIVFVRSLVAVGPLLLLARFQGGLDALRTRKPWSHLVRSVMMLATFTSFFLALAVLPLGETVTLFYTGPIFITILSVRFLSERVALDGWLAVALGFVGVAVMLRPGAGVFDPAAFLVLFAALCYAAVAVITRRMGGTENGVSMAFYPTVLYLAFTFLIGLAVGDGSFDGGDHGSLRFMFRAWKFPSGFDFLLMVVLGFIGAYGFYFLSQAYRLTRPSIIAPFEYIAVPLGALMGYLFWEDIPGAGVLPGMMLIVGSGVYVLVRGRGPCTVKSPPRFESAAGASPENSDQADSNRRSD